LDALDKLLDGKKIMVSRDKETGAFHMKEIDDPDVMATGLELYRKTVSLEEKPAQAPTIVNVQQNQNNSQQPPGGWSFESILAKIREEQKRVGSVFEAEVKEVGGGNNKPTEDQ
jgi:hypothetical protein